PFRVDRDGLAGKGPLTEVDVRLPAILKMLELTIVLGGPGFAAIAFRDHAPIGLSFDLDVVLHREDESKTGLRQQDRKQGQAGNSPERPESTDDGSDSVEDGCHEVVSACRFRALGVRVGGDRIESTPPVTTRPSPS